MKPGIVILSTNFGANFSGGCSVTHEIISRLQDQFSEIIFVGARVGEHRIRNLIFIRSSTWLNTYIILRRLKRSKHVFYGDFYNAFLLALAKSKYVFTYHDNWPELAELNFRHKIRNIFYSTVYQYIFNHASRLVTVSQYKKKLVDRLTDTPCLVIPNGFAQKDSSIDRPEEKEGILMVGNIDHRKYSLAIQLFKSLEALGGVKIDIYGHFVDKELVEELKKFPFVNLKGFQVSIPYGSYKFLLHTSFVESFGMVFLEAISNGLPVLAFDRGGAKEIVGRENGVLIEPYQVDRMRDAFYEMLKNPIKVDPASTSKYSWEKAAKSYLEVFKKAI